MDLKAAIDQAVMEIKDKLQLVATYREGLIEIGTPADEIPNLMRDFTNHLLWPEHMTRGGSE